MPRILEVFAYLLVYYIKGCVGAVWLEKFFLKSYRLYRCSILILMSMIVNNRSCRCSVKIERLLLAKYRLCRCSAVTEKLLLTNYKLHRCSVLTEILLLKNGKLYRCSPMIEQLLIPNCRLCKCNSLTLICYHYRSLTFVFLVLASCLSSSENGKGLFVSKMSSLPL